MERILVQTIVSKSPEEVWDYFTNPMHVTGWNFASDDWHCPTAKSDLRPGGAFSYRMASKDGCMGFDFEGIFTVVEPGRKLSYKLGDERNVDVEFSAEGDRTKVTELFDPEKINDAELQKNGWQAILNNFSNYCNTR